MTRPALTYVSGAKREVSVGLTNVSGAPNIVADLVFTRARSELAFVCKKRAAKRLQWQGTGSPFTLWRDSPEIIETRNLTGG